MIPDKDVYAQIDTPALLIDYDIMTGNIAMMQQKADRFGVKLRPHTKTHKMPYVAKLQIAAGAAGITVAKTAEAEVLAAHGINDIFIANEVAGAAKAARIRDLCRTTTVRLGIDNAAQADMLDAAFSGEDKPAEVLAEIEVGEVRSGVTSEEALIALAEYIKKKKHVRIRGVFSHEGHTYKAKDTADCVARALEAQARTLHMAQVLRDMGIGADIVSIGATPSMMQADILEGVTEIRPGTYVFMDVGQGSALGSFSRCAASVLTTVVSKPTQERIVLDAGAKALTSQNRAEGICSTYGYGLVKDSGNVRLYGLYDEHGLISDAGLNAELEIGRKIEVIPNHICPCCNLFDQAYMIKNDAVLCKVPIACRGRTQ
jgi:D-serine deaminase-like pyridoxal phosphate-dependent protein